MEGRKGRNRVGKRQEKEEEGREMGLKEASEEDKNE